MCCGRANVHPTEKKKTEKKIDVIAMQRLTFAALNFARTAKPGSRIEHVFTRLRHVEDGFSAGIRYSRPRSAQAPQ